MCVFSVSDRGANDQGLRRRVLCAQYTGVSMHLRLHLGHLADAFIQSDLQLESTKSICHKKWKNISLSVQ